VCAGDSGRGAEDVRVHGQSGEAGAIGVVQRQYREAVRPADVSGRSRWSGVWVLGVVSVDVGFVGDVLDSERRWTRERGILL
jgi:hypothetical protein